MRFSNMDHIFLKRDILPAPTKLDIKLGSAMVNSWLRFLNFHSQNANVESEDFGLAKSVFQKCGYCIPGWLLLQGGAWEAGDVVQTQHMSILFNVKKT